ncbi:MAG: glucose-6-phosphate isomerase, partial [Spirochaetes bacterium]
MEYRNLDLYPEFDTLKALPRVDLASVLTETRIKDYSIPLPEGFAFNYAASKVDEWILDSFQKLSDALGLVDRYANLLSGQIMNTGEGRMVLHHLARGNLGTGVVKNGVDLRNFYEEERLKAAAFAGKVHRGEILGSSGKPFQNVVQIGIGGSDLGPRAAYLALERWAKAEGRHRMKAYFISNVDPDDADNTLSALDLERSLFILVSKSGTTQETLANETLVKLRLEKAGLDPAHHMVAVTSTSSPLAQNPDYIARFYIDDYIGGRYSTSSAVGGVVLSLAFEPDAFSQFLEGAHSFDRAALERNVRKNASLLAALIGMYERNVLGYSSTAVLPYTEALSRFPAHLQ